MKSSNGHIGGLGFSVPGLLSAGQAPSRRSKNVVQIAANPAKLRKEGEQKGETRLAPFCHNLLLLSALRRLRQDLTNLLCRLEGRRSTMFRAIRKTSHLIVVPVRDFSPPPPPLKVRGGFGPSGL